MKKHLDTVMERLQTAVEAALAEAFAARRRGVRLEDCSLHIEGWAFGCSDAPGTRKATLEVRVEPQPMAYRPAAKKLRLPPFPVDEVRRFRQRSGCDELFRDVEGEISDDLEKACGSEAIEWLLVVCADRLSALMRDLGRRHRLKVEIQGQAFAWHVRRSLEANLADLARSRRRHKSTAGRERVEAFLALFTDDLDPCWWSELERIAAIPPPDPLGFVETLAAVKRLSRRRVPAALRAFYESGAYRDVIAREIPGALLGEERPATLEVMRDGLLERDGDALLTPLDRYYDAHYDGEAEVEGDDGLGEARHFFPLFVAGDRFIVVDLRTRGLTASVDRPGHGRSDEPLGSLAAFLREVCR